SVLSGEVALPLGKEGTWTLSELGYARPLLPGVVPPARLPTWLDYLLIPLAVLSASVIALRLIEVVLRERRGATFVFFLYALFQTGLIMAFWFFDDRYYLVLSAPLVVLVVRGCGLPSMRWTLAGLVALLLVS